MDKIRIGRQNVKVIEVNDEGECITLNFNDRGLVSRFYSLMEEYNKRQAEMMKRAEEIDAMESESEKNKAFIELDLEIHKWLAKEVDGVFGEGTCRKVFGDIVPSVYCYTEFFEQISPFFKEFAAAHTNKYTASRMGSAE